MRSNELPPMKKSWYPSLSENMRDSIAFFFIFVISAVAMLYYRPGVGFNTSYLIAVGVAMGLVVIYDRAKGWEKNPTSALRRVRK